MNTHAWLVAAFLAAGCHTHTVATPATSRDAKGDAKGESSNKTRSASERHAPAPTKDDDKAKKRYQGTNGTPVPLTPAAALERGQLQEIQRRLADRKLLGQHEDGNLDQPTREALRRLQKAEDLPETGLPDHETVRKLGLDPDRVFAKRREGDGKGGSQ
jgi:hypothetical protein